ncbi:hypothetical protein HYW43_00010 [Candidatus Daviesbacteria bacterium]|nr:hypothetical protein [Candidatus Daviesbacteria bacterium]
MNQIKVISHRGGFLPEGPIPTVQNQYKLPENTLEAFERAFQNGWGIETDVRLTGDGNFIIIHDADIVRFSGNQGVIDQMTASQIQKVGFKTNPSFKIPALDELFELTQKYSQKNQLPFIAFQIKRGSNPKSGVEVGEAIANGMQKFNLQTSIVFDATLEEAKQLHREFPWLNLSVSVGEENYSPTIYTPSQVLSDEFSTVYTSVWADEWKKPYSIYKKRLFENLRNVYKGRIDVISPELHYNEDHPTARDLAKLKALWQEIISWDIADGICTDYPTTLQLLT